MLPWMPGLQRPSLGSFPKKYSREAFWEREVEKEGGKTDVLNERMNE